MRRTPLALLFASTVLSLGALGGCAVQNDGLDEDEPHVDGDESEFTSKDATLLEFEFDGELVMRGSWNAKAQIDDQLLYTIGHLNGDRSVGRLDRVEITNIKTTAEAEAGMFKVTYHAKLPVAWGSKTNLPTSYDFTLPRLSTFDGYSAFTEKYKHDCVDFGAHDVDSGSMWYYYRPNNSGCQLDAALVFKTKATVTKSTLNTTGKYPEYNKVWEDGVLNVVAVFGKYEDGATNNDAGISAYNTYVSTIARELAPFNLVTTPATIPAAPGVGTPDVTYEATLAGGKKVKVVALLVDNVRTAGAAFDARYEALSTKADLIAYNGHAGLGDNVRALAKKGRWAKGQYLITFMNGCDTFAYVDGSLAETRAVLNTDDPTGTKYMEIVTNAMPAFFSSMPNASLALLRGLMKHDAPTTYEQIFASVDRSQVIVVTGEEDNTFQPGTGGGGGGTTWAGIKQTGTVVKNEEKRFDSGNIQPGKYTFSITGTGDADLYVKVGSAPTTKLYDCRPYKNGSSESCTVDVKTAGIAHVMVRGYAATSQFELIGKKN